MAKKKSAALDGEFMDLLKSANAGEEKPQSTIDKTVIGLFETALTNVRDAKNAIDQDRDARKDLQTAIEFLQFGISELKKAKK
jgi:hypothetical protein